MAVPTTKFGLRQQSLGEQIVAFNFESFTDTIGKNATVFEGLVYPVDSNQPIAIIWRVCSPTGETSIRQPIPSELQSLDWATTLADGDAFDNTAEITNFSNRIIEDSIPASVASGSYGVQDLSVPDWWIDCSESLATAMKKGAFAMMFAAASLKVSGLLFGAAMVAPKVLLAYYAGAALVGASVHAYLYYEKCMAKPQWLCAQYGPWFPAPEDPRKQGCVGPLAPLQTDQVYVLPGDGTIKIVDSQGKIVDNNVLFNMGYLVWVFSFWTIAAES